MALAIINLISLAECLAAGISFCVFNAVSSISLEKNSPIVV
jgi:hypothetical protein